MMQGGAVQSADEASVADRPSDITEDGAGLMESPVMSEREIERLEKPARKSISVEARLASSAIDLYSRMVVGWSMADHMRSSLVSNALQMACFKRRPDKGLYIHSDRGIQYASVEFRKLLDEKGFIQSMSRKGNCWDNAPSESFFHTLKTEWVDDQQYETREQARQSIFEYIEVFYNRQRKHSTIDYMTPSQADQLFRKAA